MKNITLTDYEKAAPAKWIASYESSIAHRKKMLPLINFDGNTRMAATQRRMIREETARIALLKALTK